MRIIKQGKTTRTITCNYCGCEYEFNMSDTYTDLNTTITSTSMQTRYVDCPCCGLKTYVFMPVGTITTIPTDDIKIYC